jgi:hypothetical protein
MDDQPSVRMRYIKLENGIQRTENSIVCNKMVCYGFVSSNSNWWIHDMVKGNVVMRGSANTDAIAKAQLKAGLVSLGTQFDEEVRATKENKNPKLTKEMFRDIIAEKENKNDE